ncbi:MAG: PfkB family carbohydrate kinase [Dehalococcoidales bacterium]|nr:PfkB family carbohydrate kinase [Dehalococcoidales bacterium]
MKNVRPEVVGLGALNVDHLYNVERILVDGEAAVKTASAYPGGSAANTIYGLAKLGVSTGYIGAVGDDADGNLLLRSFREVAVDSSRIKTKPGVNSGAALCLSDDLNRRSLYIAPGANNLLSETDIDTTYVNQCRILHITSFVDDKQFDLTLKLLDKLDESVKVSFSPGNLYAAKGLATLEPIIARSHVLFVNYDELHNLTGKDVAAGSQQFLDMGCRMVAVTLGKGRKVKNKTNAVAYICSTSTEAVIAPVKADRMTIVGSAGAGDAFAAGFLFGLLKKKDIRECGQLGDLVARFCLTRPGAREGLPSLKELSQKYLQVYGKAL